MSEIDTGVDSLNLMLTGGATNRDPDLSLGGRVSSRRTRGLGAIVEGKPIPALRIDDVFPACGVGAATLAVDANGSLVFTPPLTESGDGPGDPVPIAAGESKIVAGTDPNKAVRVYRESGLVFRSGSSMSLKLVEHMNGVLAHGNVSDARRVAGVTTYRALMLKGHGASGVLNVRLWTPAEGQSTVYLGVEAPDSSGVAIQSVANELTAPSGIAWTHATDEASALVIPTIGTGAYMGVWVKRVFPAGGHVAPREFIQFAAKWLEA